MSNSYTIVLSDNQVRHLKELLESRGYEAKKVPYALYSYSKPGVTATVYEKMNKLFLQGKGTADFIEYILEPEILGASIYGSGAMEGMRPHFGIDESGKGDYFGPLVIAGVYADASIASTLLELGVCDSKLITSASRIRAISEKIRTVSGISYEVIRIGPERYNEMYARFGNLNRLLAWGHARVIEVLMQKVPHCNEALSDQFANEYVLKNALKQKNINIKLEQRTKAESDVVVAAASILARETFVNWMDEASRRSGIDLPLGASKKIVEAAKKVILQYGEDILPKVAKLHFKTTKEILGE